MSLALSHRKVNGVICSNSKPYHIGAYHSLFVGILKQPESNLQYKLTFLSSNLRSREDRGGTRTVCKEMTAENFTNLVKAINLKAKAELKFLKDKLKVSKTHYH